MTACEILIAMWVVITLLWLRGQTEEKLKKLAAEVDELKRAVADNKVKRWRSGE